MQNPISFHEHILEEKTLSPEVRTDIERILDDLLIAVKSIHNKLSRAGLIDIQGEAGSENASGDAVKKLDRIAHEAVVSTLHAGGCVGFMASEEEKEIIGGSSDGKYVVVFDPLDGSSNIDANVSVGTIFSIYKRKNEAENANEQVLRRGSEQIVAGYVIYGSSTMLVYTVGAGTHGFTLDPSLGEFYLSHPHIQTPVDGTVYSINEVYEPHFSGAMKAFLSEIKEHGRYTGRYIGSLVADVHRNLLYGGIYIYPDKPKAKLRLLYEGFPMGWIVEQAGGAASNGTQKILDMIPAELHQRTQLVIGSKNDVARYEELVKQEELGTINA
ncbi:MAG: class 1 fructose-bisphosphatase [Candidatus Andersenbacteria bacterium]|nr:class 1 fructose-bisphosphatase [Candidatus Andersenbacteria bacterium]MBI3250916.1 class 1 fructose-bisphosphatase [Candidatus Andersenbacteria bacterium]